MEQITEYLLHSDIPTEQCEHLMRLIGEYGKKQWTEGLHAGTDIAGYGTPPAPTIRNEVRNNQNNVGV